MTTQTSNGFARVAVAEASETSRGCCGSDAKGGRMKWLIVAAATLSVIALVTGSAVFGFAAIAPLLYALPCLAMCGMCLIKHGGTAKS